MVVSDDTGTYTVEHDNLWTSSYDVSYPTGRDANSTLMQLAADPDGVTPAAHRVRRRDAAVSSATQRSARIADVTLPDGIKVAATTVSASSTTGTAPPAPQTIEGTLTIPAGMSLYGTPHGARRRAPGGGD